jgi:RNA polymerase sigma-70 factor (ECF subfamily)
LNPDRPFADLQSEATVMQLDPAYDELLVLRSQDGDKRALDELVERWHARFFRHACRLTANPDSARDAVQEAWIAIVRGLRKLDDPARFAPWAYRILSNKCVDWVRKQGRKRRLDQSLVERQRPEDAIVEQHPERDEARQAVVDALQSLPRGQQGLLALYYQDGFEVGEIAQILEIPVGTVKSRLFHARNALKNALEGENDD